MRSHSFFRAINPASRYSGIQYSLATGRNCNGKEMLDEYVSHNLIKALTDDLNFFEGIAATYEILVGTHYDIPIKGRDDCKGGAKGLLDYIIWPLVARKLIADSYLDERKSADIKNTVAFSIGIPLEVARFSTGFLLTGMLVPVVAMVHLLKAAKTSINYEDLHPGKPKESDQLLSPGSRR